MPEACRHIHVYIGVCITKIMHRTTRSYNVLEERNTFYILTLTFKYILNGKYDVFFEQIDAR